jgi:hypothetical protein
LDVYLNLKIYVACEGNTFTQFHYVYFITLCFCSIEAEKNQDILTKELWIEAEKYAKTPVKTVLQMKN